MRDLETIYPRCHSLIDEELWARIALRKPLRTEPDVLPATLRLLEEDSEFLSLPPFLPALADLELALFETDQMAVPNIAGIKETVINPSARIVQLEWTGLIPFLDSGNDGSLLPPHKGEENILVWKPAPGAPSRVKAAENEDLLTLKMVAEGITEAEASDLGRVPVSAIEGAMKRAISRGLLLAPGSAIRRALRAGTERTDASGEEFLVSPYFVLQWHVTQACDLHCSHCYDRSARNTMALDESLRVLDDLKGFCDRKRVKGQISFSGGNPFLYSGFKDLYRAASEAGFTLAILGNPVSSRLLEEFLSIKKPEFFQVSLEGLKEHNDVIRGPGHFDRIMEFLDLLRESRLYSMVMLTLTEQNMDQVIPLADLLRDRADLFTFNRLSQVGEGANLRLPTTEKYAAFLEDYLAEAQTNPVIALKDNLINVIRHQNGQPLFGGCTGFGCGAAFNFMTLLPDGEIHACRKFPSLLGNVRCSSLEEVYDSPTAAAYRAGSRACTGCSIRAACGSCMAVLYGQGLDPFEDLDPYCMI